jgi:PadR family transcriptional regulator PadR
MGKPTELLQGTLDLLILKTLALEPMHGWGITLRIQQITGEVLQVRPGALYPALSRLEHHGWIVAKWGESAAGRRAKYYTLTRSGRSQLERESEQWRRLSSAVTILLDTV